MVGVYKKRKKEAPFPSFTSNLCNSDPNICFTNHKLSSILSVSWNNSQNVEVGKIYGLLPNISRT